MKSGNNVAASIRQRLLNIAREQKVEFQLILTRFALERFLYRLSKTKYSNDFVLKGAMLFQVWGGALSRPTRDLDLLSFGDPDIAHFAKVIAEICRQDCPEDGIIYDGDSIQLEPIKEEDEYQGLRATFLATLDSARLPLQMDIGFGDAIVPTPTNIDYPTLLDLPSPKLRAYSQETVIAEKFHAMVHRGIANSRMKDFYDLWVLATSYHFNFGILRESIKSTFKRRGTEIPKQSPIAFTEEFVSDTVKLTQWRAFLRKSKLSDPKTLGLNQVVTIIAKMIMPIVLQVPDKADKTKIWDPKNLRWLEKL